MDGNWNGEGGGRKKGIKVKRNERKGVEKRKRKEQQQQKRKESPTKKTKEYVQTKEDKRRRNCGEWRREGRGG